MKALSLLQPWAWIMTHPAEVEACGVPAKLIENRTWHTRHRGRTLVHAGKGFDSQGLAWIRERFPQLRLPVEWERGGIVGEFNLVHCVTGSDSPWFFGPFGFVVRDGHALPFQPCKGALGFFVPAIEGAATTRQRTLL